MAADDEAVDGAASDATTVDEAVAVERVAEGVARIVDGTDDCVVVVVFVTAEEATNVVGADIVVEGATVGTEVVEDVVDVAVADAVIAGATADAFIEDTVLATTSSTATLGRAIVSATSSNAKSS